MAEIVLLTGTPGTGKTLKLVSMMRTDPMFQPDENGVTRKIFTNIKGLKIPHVHVITDAKNQPASTDEQLSFHDMYKWIALEENHGSIVIIDEAQDVWPARTSGSKIPENVSWLNTHRHLGVDIFVLTQNPKNLDINLRGLVKKHWHIAMNKLGMRTLLEWKYCADNPIQQAKNAFASLYKLDDKAYDLYTSAEVHTENKVKRSKWVYVLPVVLVLVPVFLGLSYYMLKSYGHQQDAGLSAQAGAASAPLEGGAPVNASSPVQGGNLTAEMFVPTLAEKPESKPIYNGVRQVKTYERIAACVSGGKTGCTCYSDQATPLKEVTQEMCRKYAKDGLPFDPYREPPQTAQNAQNSEAETPSNASVLPSNQAAELGGKSRQNLMYDGYVEAGQKFN